MQWQADIIDEIVKSARAIRRTLPAEPQRITHVDLIEQAAALARRALGSTPLRLQLQQAPCLYELEIDAARLARALGNVIVNAATHGPPGEPVVIAASSSGAGLDIRIERGGAGVDPRELSDPAWRGSGARSRLALDMALAREWIEMQGARVMLRADGNPRPPSVVIRLPAERVRQRAKAPRPSSAARHAPQRLDGIHVLLVEDDPDALDFLSLVLAQTGAVLSAFSLTGPAFDFIASSSRSPDVLISDIAMPVEDGYSFVRRLRQWEAAHARIPIPAIAVSAFAREEDAQRAIASGFDRHVAKPVDTARLLDLVASFISPRH